MALKSKTSGRGVENPIPSDFALIGDTKMELHTKSLPRRMGPNFGYGQTAPDDDYRVTDGGASSESGGGE